MRWDDDPNDAMPPEPEAANPPERDAAESAGGPPVVPAGYLRTGILGLGALDLEVPPLPAGARLAAAWPRYWARTLDLIIESVLIGFLVGAVAPSVFASMRARPGGTLLVNMIYMPMILILDGIILALFGTTPGKAIQGVRVRDVDGRSPGLARAMERNLGLYFAGYGLGIPVIALITYIVNYRRVTAGDLTFWDRHAGTRVFDQGVTPLRTWVTSLLCLAILVFSLVVTLRSRLAGQSG